MATKSPVTPLFSAPPTANPKDSWLWTLVFNWILCLSGDSNICKWLQDIPDSAHSVQSLQAQPIAEDYLDGQTGVLVTAYGKVTFDYDGSQFTTIFDLFSMKFRVFSFVQVVRCIISITPFCWLKLTRSGK